MPYTCKSVRGPIIPFTVIRTMYNGRAAFIAQEHELTGPALCYSTACSSSSVAIGEAMRQIRHGYADVMVAGGSESLLTYSAFNIWSSGRLLAAVSDLPAQSCRPFSANRDGTALGEGAVFLVLEAEDHARSRGARVYAELAGYGIAGDCAHVTQPSVDGQATPMRLALDDAGSTQKSLITSKRIESVPPQRCDRSQRNQASLWCTCDETCRQFL